MTALGFAAPSKTEDGLLIRPMNEADVATVVRLHGAAFPDNFMTTFGRRFLRAFYAGLIAHPDGYGCVVADSADRPVGFCVGGTGSAQKIARTMLFRRPLSFLWPTTFNVLRSPRRLARVLKLARSYLTRTGSEEAPASSALLMQIAVAEDLRGSNAAEQLLAYFMEELRRRGATSVRLGVAPDNARAKAFYRRIGFQELDAGTFERQLAADPQS